MEGWQPAATTATVDSELGGHAQGQTASSMPSSGPVTCCHSIWLHTAPHCGTHSTQQMPPVAAAVMWLCSSDGTTGQSTYYPSRKTHIRPLAAVLIFAFPPFFHARRRSAIPTMSAHAVGQPLETHTHTRMMHTRTYEAPDWHAGPLLQMQQ